MVAIFPIFVINKILKLPIPRCLIVAICPIFVINKIHVFFK